MVYLQGFNIQLKFDFFFCCHEKPFSSQLLFLGCQSIYGHTKHDVNVALLFIVSNLSDVAGM